MKYSLRGKKNTQSSANNRWQHTIKQDKEAASTYPSLMMPINSEGFPSFIKIRRCSLIVYAVWVRVIQRGYQTLKWGLYLFGFWVAKQIPTATVCQKSLSTHLNLKCVSCSFMNWGSYAVMFTIYREASQYLHCITQQIILTIYHDIFIVRLIPDSALDPGAYHKRG